MSDTVPMTVRLPRSLYAHLRKSMTESKTATLSAEVVRQLSERVQVLERERASAV